MDRNVNNFSAAGFVSRGMSALLICAGLIAGASHAGSEPHGRGEAETPSFSLLPHQVHVGAGKAHSVAVGDVTGDGLADVVITTGNSTATADAQQLLVYAQNRAGSLEAPRRYPHLQTTSSPALALLDLDGLGGLDVVVGGDSGSTRFVSRVDGGLTTAGITPARSTTTLMPLALDDDDQIDLVSAGWDGGGDYLLGNGAGALAVTPWNHAGGAWSGMARADFDSDGVDDVVAISPLGMFNNLFVFAGTGAGALVEQSTRYAKCSTSGWAWGVAAGDLDADGNADIVVSGGGNTPSSCLLLFAGHGDGTFSPPVEVATRDLPKVVVVADINLDDRDDVVVLHDAWMSVGVHLQNDSGTLGDEANYPVPYAAYGPQALTVADINGDGCPDVAIADSLHGLVTLAGSGCDRISRKGFDSL